MYIKSIHNENLGLKSEFKSLHQLAPIRTLVKSVYQKNDFLISKQRHNVVGTQKNRLNETVLLSTKTYVKTDG